MKEKLITPSDLSDMGNIIGLKIGPYISKELGFESKDLINGIEHGVSLIDGTHFDGPNDSPIKATQTSFAEFANEKFWDLREDICEPSRGHVASNEALLKLIKTRDHSMFFENLLKCIEVDGLTFGQREFIEKVAEDTAYQEIREIKK